MTLSFPSRAAVLLQLALALLLTCATFAQVGTTGFPENSPASKFDVFAGYSYLKPSGTLDGRDASVMNKGFDASLTYNFGRSLGFTEEFSGYFGGDSPRTTWAEAFGPRLAYPGNRFRPFVEAMGLFGGVRSAANPSAMAGIGGAAGGGLDLRLTHRFSWRVVQADYLHQHYFNPQALTSSGLGGLRLQSGLVISFGNVQSPQKHSVHSQTRPHPLPKELACAEPPSGALSGTESADVRAVTAGQAETHAPTISCSATPAVVKSGDPVTIACTLGNPDSRALSKNCKSSAGKVSSNADNFILDTAGVPPSSVLIDCGVTDDRGLTNSSSTSVQVHAPPAPPATKVFEVLFKDRNRPARVDNVAKALLDDLALRMNRDIDLKVVIVGHIRQSENDVQLARQRAVNIKAYLTREKGIDPARIALRTGADNGNRADIDQVPTGAEFDERELASFDESKLAPQVERARHRTSRKNLPRPSRKAPVSTGNPSS
jgi:hypothetical protein